MGFLKFIFISLLVMWLVGLIIRGAVNRWLRKRTEEFNRAAKAAQKEARRRAGSHREGDVTIEEAGTKAGKKVSRSVGEYVEFEEYSAGDEPREDSDDSKKR